MKHYNRQRDLRSNQRNYWHNEVGNDGDYYYTPMYSQRKCIITNQIDGSLASGLIENIKPLLKTRFFDNNEHLILDAFKSWYCEDKTVSVKPEFYWWHHALSMADNRLLKKITQNRAGYSFIAARTLITEIDKLARKYGENDFERILEDLANGKVDEDTKNLKEDLEKLVNRVGNKIKKDLEKAEKADKNAGKGNTVQDIEIMDLLLDKDVARLININEKDINKFIKQTIDKAIESVGGKVDIKEESIFESDDIEDIVNVEDFAHVALFEDINVRRRSYHISFDVYIDDSGSMCSSVNVGGKSIKLDKLARLVAFKLYKLKMLRDIYLFSHENTLTKISIGDLFTAKIDGGTQFKQCIDNVKKNNRPSIIITDGCDHIDAEDDYCDNIFFLVLEYGHMQECFSKYAKNKKLCFYNRGVFHEAGFDNDGYIVPRSLAVC